MLETLRSSLALARWLGPWADEQKSPSVRRSTVHVPASQPGERAFRAWVYRPSLRPHGSMLLVQGLHYAGPEDPRLDRFCKILAASGTLVLAPFLPDFAHMRVEPTLGTDLERAFDHLLSLPDLPRRTRPGIFSVSFGSLPAIQVAARRPEVGGLMLFGGYADFHDTIHFSMEGAPGRPYDPLNHCVAFINLLEQLPAKDPASLEAGWIEMIKRTWGRPHMKENDAHHVVAREIASRLVDTELFLQTTGVLPGSRELFERALGDKDIGFLDPLPWARQVQCPAVVAHGREDDVIPFEQAAILAAALPHSRLHLTGLYSHSGHSGIGMIPAELSSMVGILVGMAKTGRGL